MPENNIRSVKQNPFTPPATSPTELTTYIGTPPTLNGRPGSRFAATSMTILMRYCTLMDKTYVHTVIDDQSRVAYAEIHDDETAITATAVWVKVGEWLNACGELAGWLHYYKPPPAPHSLQQPAAILTIDQRPWSVHLASSRLRR